MKYSKGQFLWFKGDAEHDYTNQSMLHVNSVDSVKSNYSVQTVGTGTVEEMSEKVLDRLGYRPIIVALDHRGADPIRAKYGRGVCIIDIQSRQQYRIIGWPREHKVGLTDEPAYICMDAKGYRVAFGQTAIEDPAQFRELPYGQ